MISLKWKENKLPPISERLEDKEEARPTRIKKQSLKIQQIEHKESIIDSLLLIMKLEMENHELITNYEELSIQLIQIKSLFEV